MPDAFAHEAIIRLAAFGGIFAAMAVWEILGPRRETTVGRALRWPNNLGLVVLNTVLVRILFPTTAVGMALLPKIEALASSTPSRCHFGLAQLSRS